MAIISPLVSAKKYALSTASLEYRDYDPISEPARDLRSRINERSINLRRWLREDGMGIYVINSMP
jgi:hypothetical protein